MSDQALTGIKVLDVGHHIAGPYCTKLLADFGADVIKVERPDGGDPSRRMGPFPNDEPNQEASGYFLYLNNNKKSITLNLKTETGLKIFKELVKKTDILVENFSPKVMPKLGLSYSKLKKINPGLIMTSISNFGQSGPYKDYKATDIVIQALGGWVWARGTPDREPVRGGGRLRLSEFVGGTYAATATLTAYFSRLANGTGQQVDISLLEAVTCMMPQCSAFAHFPNNAPYPHLRLVFTPGVEKCKDGFIGVNTLTGQQWVSICQMMGMEDFADNPDFQTLVGRLFRRDDVLARISPWLMEHTKDEIFTEGQAWRIPVAPVPSTEDIVNSPQHKDRGYIVEADQPVAGKLAQPGPILKMSETPWKMKAPAPLLGQHNEEIYGKLLGYNKEDLVRLRQSDII